MFQTSENSTNAMLHFADFQLNMPAQVHKNNNNKLAINFVTINYQSVNVINCVRKGVIDTFFSNYHSYSYANLEK